MTNDASQPKSESIATRKSWRTKFVIWYTRLWAIAGTAYAIYATVMFGVNLWKAKELYKEVTEARPIIYASGGGQVGARRINCTWRSIEKPSIELKGEGQLTLKPGDFVSFDAGTCRYPAWYVFSTYGVFTLLGVRADGSETEAKLFDVPEEHEDFAFDPTHNKLAVKFKNAIAIYNLSNGYLGFNKIDFPTCARAAQGNFSGIQWLPSGEFELSFSQNSCEKFNLGGGKLPIDLKPLERNFFRRIKV